MNTSWIPLQSIPAEGSVLVLEDQALWQSFLAEYNVTCRIVTPVRAELQVLPQEEGILFRGKVTGTVALPCNRCAEDSIAELHHSFDSFEPYPADPHLIPAEGDEDSDSLEVDEAVIRVAAFGRGFEINPAALAWEEFSLALPVKPLCSEDCKGLCPVCGNNKNTEKCTCVTEQGDPRLSALRGLTIKK